MTKLDMHLRLPCRARPRQGHGAWPRRAGGPSCPPRRGPEQALVAQAALPAQPGAGAGGGGEGGGARPDPQPAHQAVRPAQLPGVSRQKSQVGCCYIWHFDSELGAGGLEKFVYVEKWHFLEFLFSEFDLV